MKASQTYLKGKSVFIVSLLVVILTTLTVYLTGIDFNRSIGTNFYLSLGIISAFLFSFMSYGLYKGIGLIDDFDVSTKFKPKFKLLEVSNPSSAFDVDLDTGFMSVLLAIVLWILVSIALLAMLILLEAVFMFSLMIILTMLYWVFFRAMRLVFSKSHKTVGKIGSSLAYSFGYTLLFMGWMFGIVYLAQKMTS